MCDYFVRVNEYFVQRTIFSRTQKSPPERAGRVGGDVIDATRRPA